MSASQSSMARLTGVYKTFYPGTANERRVFSGFDLAVEKGSFVTVVGSNGSGKTTLLNLLSGSIRSDAGRIEVDGGDITRLTEYRRARFIGRVHQDPSKGACPQLTILENMSLADNKGKPFGLTRGVNQKRVNEYRDMLSTLRLGLEDRLRMPVGTLSGGQRQALALLLCTMSPLKLLLLDEHTAALDPRSSERVMELTERVVRKEKITTLMVTHNMKFATRYGDRLVMLHEGKAVIDITGAEKANTPAETLYKTFQDINLAT